jgi:hypothetical protein
MIPNLEEIIKEWEDDSKIDRSKLDETTCRLAACHAKYISYFSSYKLRLRRKEGELADLKKEKWLYYTGKYTKGECDERGWPYDPFGGNAKPLKNDLDYYFDSDSDLKSLGDTIEYISTCVDALKEILDTIRWRHSAIKNIIDFKKFEAGV